MDVSSFENLILLQYSHSIAFKVWPPVTITYDTHVLTNGSVSK